jgi:aminoglycoside 3-N-acetyltransferase
VNTYTRTNIHSAFDAIGLAAGDVVLVHCAMYAFGLLQGSQVNQVDSILYHTLRAHIGPAGTIMVPTFNFGFCKGAPFNIRHTPSKGMGIFSEYVRLLPNSVRSKHPMQSVSVNGPQADYLCEKDTGSSFDLDGPFDRFIALQGKVLLLGAPMQSVSLVHYVEERQQVPYRYWKGFSGDYTDEAGKQSLRTYQMYARDLQLDPQLKLAKIEVLLAEAHKISISPLGVGSVKCFLARDFINITQAHVEQNPYFLIQ